MAGSRRLCTGLSSVCARRGENVRLEIVPQTSSVETDFRIPLFSFFRERNGHEYPFIFFVKNNSQGGDVIVVFRVLPKVLVLFLALNLTDFEILPVLIEVQSIVSEVLSVLPDPEI